MIVPRANTRLESLLGRKLHDERPDAAVLSFDLGRIQYCAGVREEQLTKSLEKTTAYLGRETFGKGTVGGMNLKIMSSIPWAFKNEDELGSTIVG